MKRNALLLLVLVVATSRCFANVRSDPSPVVLFGNEPPLGGVLRGETVYVVLGQNDASVEAVYDVTDFSPSADSVLLPVFARSDENPKDVLSGARIRASLSGTMLSDISVASPPGGSPAVPAEVQVVWARIKMGSAFQSQVRTTSLNLRVSYVQRHIDRKFYYLPQSVPAAPSEKLAHNWRYPLIARAPNRALTFSAGGCSWERLGEVLIVYLRADQIVAIEAK